MLFADRDQNGFEHRCGHAIAFLSSLIFHVSLLLMLACWLFTAGKPSEGLLLSADIGESPATTLDVIQAFELQANYELPDAEDSVADVDLEVEMDAPMRPAESDGEYDPVRSAPSVGDVADELAKRSGKSSGRGASFFGSYAEGNRFVYVLDSSGSMEGDRWKYACTQLLDSLNGLSPGQEFYVVCFDAVTTFLFNTPPARAHYFEADDDTILRVKRWLRSRNLGGSTMPAQALKFALSLEPDAIFLLSDGELKDNSQLMLRLINSNVSERRQIPIHTIHLFSMQGRLTLQRIAMENQGTFTPIEHQRAFGRFSRR